MRFRFKPFPEAFRDFAVVFDYQGYRGYPELFLLGALVLGGALLVDVTRSIRSRRESLRRLVRLGR